MALALLCFLSILVGAGCKKDEIVKAPGENFEIRKEYARGPVVFTLKVNKKEITIADRLRLDLEVRANEEYEVQLPEFGEKLEEFAICDYSAPSPQLVEDGLVLSRKSYELEPFLSGEYKIPPMRVTFWKKGEEEKHEVASEELAITVTSLLPEQADGLTIKEIAPPVEFPKPARLWLYVSVGAVALGAGGIGAFLFWRRRRLTPATVVTKAAHEVAYEELETLLAERLVERGERKGFYVQLSSILRHYIENRFSLRAPERTTEEFLADLRATDVLMPAHKDLLKEFLEHCDMVKFAEHSPTNDEIQKTFDACKRFVVETERPRDGTPAVSGG
jgi:hypothetical protein